MKPSNLVALLAILLVTLFPFEPLSAGGSRPELELVCPPEVDVPMMRNATTGRLFRIQPPDVAAIAEATCDTATGCVTDGSCAFLLPGKPHAGHSRSGAILCFVEH